MMSYSVQKCVALRHAFLLCGVKKHANVNFLKPHDSSEAL